MNEKAILNLKKDALIFENLKVELSKYKATNVVNGVMIDTDIISEALETIYKALQGDLNALETYMVLSSDNVYKTLENTLNSVLNVHITNDQTRRISDRMDEENRDLLEFGIDEITSYLTEYEQKLFDEIYPFAI